VILRFLALALATAAPLAAQSSDTTATQWSSSHPAYADDQAARGEKAYQMYCASCHTTDFHTGEGFRFGWFGRTVYDLFKVLKTTMPEDNVGGLSDDEYTRVIAYILKLNGFPAGSDSLRADSLEMRRIRIGGPTDTAKVSKP
jgi:mono/diheme cytochrome c family protein